MTHDDETLAMIAAAYEDAADICADETWHHIGDDAYSRGLDRGAAEQASTCAAAIRSLTPSDAQAALDRMLRQEKNEALEKAAEHIRKTRCRACRDGLVTGYHDTEAHEAAQDIRAMKEPEE